MKRFLKLLSILLLIMLLVQPCFAEDLDEYYYVIEFGSYEQDNDLSNGKEPIEWYILERGDYEVLLISKYALDCQPYNSIKDKDVTWVTSSLRRWLQDIFYTNAFSTEEQKLIEISSNTNGKEDGNPKYDTNGGIATDDKVGLLSVAEYNYYIGEDDDCYSTEYAIAKGCKDKTTWWLRSPGKKQTDASVCGKGKATSTEASDDSIGVRPVIQLDLSIEHETMPFDIYIAGVDAYESENYELGAEIFDSLGDYQDAYIMTSLCKFFIAGNEIEKDDADVEKALKLLNDYEEYSMDKLGFCIDDYYELLTIVNYLVAEGRQEKGDYTGAAEIYYSMTYYDDCMENLLQCLDKLKTQYHWMTKDTTVVNAGDRDEYSKQDELTAKDLHFGWSLGRFLVSDYTEYDDSGNIPVLVKTPGDDIRLMFVAEQDIDALNGDENLIIAEDEKGSDRQFQIPKSNFGRGALFIRHTKSDGDTEVSSYFDFLSALSYGVADTAISIKEEGKYEVALDYRVEEDELFGSHNDYRILFEFEVKNGSGMSYLFDLETGAELTDYSVTDAGFRIDLANSKSLSINVTRYGINATENGLDVRATSPAADGETYDKTGYYEVSTTNKETGEKITKRLFVGRSSDLEDYITASADLEVFIG